MRSLPIPTDKARSTFLLCVDTKRDDDLSQRLESVAEKIEAAEMTYIEEGKKGALYTIAAATSIDDRVTVDEMVSLYTDTFVRHKTTRPIYDKILAAPPHGICPLCGQQIASSLDHYLAKTNHPALAVTPANLVPSCSACNYHKHIWQPSCPSEQTLHPYFDDVNDDVWLIADIEEGIPPALVFSAKPPSTWDDIKQKRVVIHLETYKLGSLYSSHAAVELINIHGNLMEIAKRSGPNSVREHLLEQARSRKAAEKNSWQSAMYNALARSDWFCNEGYKHIV